MYPPSKALTAPDDFYFNVACDFLNYVVLVRLRFSQLALVLSDFPVFVVLRRFRWFFVSPRKILL